MQSIVLSLKLLRNLKKEILFLIKFTAVRILIKCQSHCLNSAATVLKIQLLCIALYITAVRLIKYVI